MGPVSVLIPTCDRSAALAATLVSLCYQDIDGFDVIIADQSERDCREHSAPVMAAVRLLQQRGHGVEVLRNLPRRGMAQQRQFLLDHSRARYSLYIDDDVLLEPFVIGMLRDVLDREKCGFAGNALIGLSYRDDVRPAEQKITFHEQGVEPETIAPGDPRWDRHKLHNAANILHVQETLDVSHHAPLCYRVAWVGGCVMYDTARLREAGGFEFWKSLPFNHCGEDVLAQLNVASRFGGCGVLPSGVYHQELETTIPDRRINAPEYLGVTHRDSLHTTTSRT